MLLKTDKDRQRIPIKKLCPQFIKVVGTVSANSGQSFFYSKAQVVSAKEQIADEDGGNDPG